MRAGRAVLAALSILLLAGLARPSIAEPAIAENPRSLIDQARAAMPTDPALAIANARAAAGAASRLAGPRRVDLLATAEWLQAEGSLRLGNLAAARQLIRSSMSRIGTADLNAKLRGDILLTRGGIVAESGAVARALADYQSAYKLFQKVNDDRSRALSIINIAVLYDEASDPETALRYYSQARELTLNDTGLNYWILSNMSQALKNLHRYSEAAVQTRAALSLARRSSRTPLVFHMLRNLARIELLSGHLAQADREIAEAFALADKLPRDDEASSLLATAAQAALQHGRVAQAVTLIGRSFDGIDPARTTLPFRERHQTAYDIYRRADDLPRALVHLAALKRLDDEATKLATSASAALMGARFNFANQEARIAKLRADEAQRNLALEQARAANQRLVFFGASGATTVIIAILGVSLVTLRRSRNKVRDANVVLGETNVALGKALAAKTEFLATTSHEIRTPLNGILGMAQVMLADGSLDRANCDRIRILHGAGLTMRALVDDILDVAKIETGNLTIEHAPVDICAVLGEVTRLCGEQARAKGLAFKADLSACSQIVMGDAARLRQIVFNLLSNAIKFTLEGSVTLTTQKDSDGSAYEIRVSDTGIGIPADKIDLIFDSFQQGDTSTTRRFGGTGLGLSICRNLARAMGGDVSVASLPGRGSSFTLRLPLIEAEAPSVAAEVRDAFLVIERNPITRSMLKALVEPHAPRVLLASSLDEAVASIETGAVARILADDATLRVAGEVVDGVCRLKPGVESLILLWTPTDDAERARLIEAGVDRLIAKPITRSSLVTQLRDNMDYLNGRLVSQAA